MQDGMQQRGPDFGESPRPGHWAAPFGGFAEMAYIAHGLDCLAEQAGLADGLALLLKTCGLTLERVQAAGRGQCREWYYACYGEYSGRPLAGAWDVVAVGHGIFSPGSGWDAPFR